MIHPPSSPTEQELISFSRRGRSLSLTDVGIKKVMGLERTLSSPSLVDLYNPHPATSLRMKRLRIMTHLPSVSSPLPSPVDVNAQLIQSAATFSKWTPKQGRQEVDNRTVWIDLVFRSLDDSQKFQNSASQALRNICALIPSSVEPPRIRFSCPLKICHEMISALSAHFSKDRSDELLTSLLEKVQDLNQQS